VGRCYYRARLPSDVFEERASGLTPFGFGNTSLFRPPHVNWQTMASRLSENE
jgi:hypothetical protein